MGREVMLTNPMAAVDFDYDRAKMGVSKGDQPLWVDPKLFIWTVDRLRWLERHVANRVEQPNEIVMSNVSQ